MNIKQETKKLEQELKRTQSNDQKWKLFIEYLAKLEKTQ